MVYKFQPLVSAKKCEGKPQVGLVALSEVLETLFPKQVSWGIYNCRNVSGTTMLSHHAEGRAYDVGIGFNRALGDKISLALLENAYELGLDHLIWFGTKWSAKYPSGTPYYGSSVTLRHEDHIHVGMAWAEATTITETKILEILKEADKMVNQKTSNPSFQPAFDAAVKAGIFSEYTNVDDVMTAEKLAVFLHRAGIV